VTAETSEDLVNDGVIQAQTRLDIAARDLLNAGLITAGEQNFETGLSNGVIEFTGRNLVNDVTGVISAGVADFVLSGDFDNSGVIVLQDGLSVNAAQTLRQTGLVQTGAAVTLSAAEILTNADTQFSAAGDIVLNARGDLVIDGLTLTDGSITGQAASAVIRGAVAAGGAAEFTAVNLVADAASVLQANQIALTIDNALIANGAIEAVGTISLASNTLVSNGVIISEGLSVASNEATLGDTAIWSVDNAITLDVVGAFDSSGNVIASSQVSLSAADIVNSGAIQVGALDDNGDLLPGGIISLNGSTLSNTEAGVIFGGGADFDISQTFNNAGGIAISESLSVSTSLFENAGVISGAALTTLNIGTGQNTGQLVAGSIALNFEADFTNSGFVESLTDAQITGQNLINSGILLANSGEISLGVNSLQNAEAAVIQADTLDIAIATPFANSGEIIGLSAFDITTPSLSNAGLIVAGIEDTPVNLTLVLEVFENTGSLQVTGNLNIDAFNHLNSGFIAANNLLVAGGDLTNSGNIEAVQNVTANITGGVNNSGVLLAGGALNISSFDLVNSETSAIAALLNGVELSASNLIDNAGLVQAAQSLSLAAIDITNQPSGEIVGTDVTTITASGNVVLGGTVLGSDVSVSANTLTSLIDSGIQTGGDVTFDVQGALIATGAIIASSLTIDADSAQLNAESYLEIVGQTDIDVATDLNLFGQALLQGDTNFEAINVTQSEGSIVEALGDISLTAQSANISGGISANNITAVLADLTIAETGALLANNTITLSGLGPLNVDGLIQSGLNLDIGGDNIVLGATGFLVSAVADIQARESLINAGLIQTGALSVETLNYQDTEFARLIAEDNIILETGAGDIALSGIIASIGLPDETDLAGQARLAAGNVALSGRSLTLAETGLISAGGIDLAFAADITNVGNIEGRDLTVTAQGAITNAAGAGIVSETFANLTANTITQNGTLVTGEALTVMAQGGVANTGFVQSGQALLLMASDYSNAGTVVALDTLDITAARITQSRDAVTQANGALTLNVSDRAELAGVLFAGSDITANVASLEIRGNFVSEGAVNIVSDEASLRPADNDRTNLADDFVIPEAIIQSVLGSSITGTQSLAIEGIIVSDAAVALITDGSLAIDGVVSGAGVTANADGLTLGTDGLLTSSVDIGLEVGMAELLGQIGAQGDVSLLADTAFVSGVIESAGLLNIQTIDTLDISGAIIGNGVSTQSGAFESSG